MTKQKSSAQIYVADGAGGMRPVTDLRFEAGEWPIELPIPAKDAQAWMAHLNAEIEERGWSSSTFSQFDAAENSGTLSVHTANGSPPPSSLDIVWEKVRNGDLQLRARPSGNPILPLDVAREFVDAIGVRQRAGKMRRAHQRMLLSYEGLPWRGELWLDADHRLGPPLKHPDALIGPQILIVDAMIEGIGWQGVATNFQKHLQELRVFLSFVLGLNAKISKFEQGWVSDVKADGQIDCTLGYVGYAETSLATGFPAVGSAPPIERREVERPGLGLTGIWPDMHAQWVPADIEQLWDTFVQLPSLKREHLLRAGNAHLIARSMWPDQRTAYVAFLVVACEALKPNGKRYDRMNIYDVVASLVGINKAQRLRELDLHPQKVRSEHLHRGKLSAGELLPMFIHDYFMDPSSMRCLENCRRFVACV